MTWEQMLEALVGLMGRQVLVQGWPADPTPGAPHLPFLAVFGELRGGPAEPVDGADAVMLDIAASSEGSNGAALLVKPLFTTAARQPSGTLEITLGPVVLEITEAASDPQPAVTSLQADAAGDEAQEPTFGDENIEHRQPEAGDEPAPAAHHAGAHLTCSERTVAATYATAVTEALRSTNST